MTTRRWIVAVTVVGLLMGGAIGVYRLKQRRRACIALAKFHEGSAGYCSEMAARDVDPPFLLRAADHEGAVARRS